MIIIILIRGGRREQEAEGLMMHKYIRHLNSENRALACELDLTRHMWVKNTKFKSRGLFVKTLPANVQHCRNVEYFK